jgi:hypothetical protein
MVKKIAGMVLNVIALCITLSLGYYILTTKNLDRGEWNGQLPASKFILLSLTIIFRHVLHSQHFQKTL